jgi:hypothetical protein
VKPINDLDRLGNVFVGEVPDPRGPITSTARRAARSKPRRVASRSTRAANWLGTSLVSVCAALSIAAE